MVSFSFTLMTRAGANSSRRSIESTRSFVYVAIPHSLGTYVPKKAMESADGSVPLGLNKFILLDWLIAADKGIRLKMLLFTKGFVVKKSYR